MPDENKGPGARSQGGDLFIVDNSDADWNVLDYLRERKLDHLRILMDDEGKDLMAQFFPQWGF